MTFTTKVNDTISRMEAKLPVSRSRITMPLNWRCLLIKGFVLSCAAGVTVYLTVTASPSTVTLFDGPSPEPTAASINLQVFTAIPDIHTSPEITATTTIFLTYTEAVRVAQATQSTGNLGNGEPYYFTEHEGSTAWLSGKAPATTDGTITGTTTVLVAPVPSGGNTHTSSTETVFLTVTSTRRITETIVEAHNTATTSARSFGGIGASGWNATSTTFQTVTIGPSGSGVIVSGIQFSGTGTASGVVQGLPTGYLQAASAASTNVTRVYVKRQVGSIVVATINGVVVSWTNVYNGGASATRVSTSSSSLAASVSPGMLDISTSKLFVVPTDLWNSRRFYNLWLCVFVVLPGIHHSCRFVADFEGFREDHRTDCSSNNGDFSTR